MMSTQDQYPTDVTDGQWHHLQRLLPKPRWQPGGRRCRLLPLRQVLNGVALSDENWLPMATIAAEFRPMIYDLWLLQSLGARGDLATDPHRARTTRAPTPRTALDAFGGQYR